MIAPTHADMLLDLQEKRLTRARRIANLAERVHAIATRSTVELALGIAGRPGTVGDALTYTERHRRHAFRRLALARRLHSLAQYVAAGGAL